MLYIFVLVIALIVLGAGFFFKTHFQILMMSAAGVFVVGTLACSYMQVEPGEIGFTKTFGSLSYKTYDAGVHFVNPFASGLRANIRRQSLDYTGEETAEGLTRNKVALLVDLTVPWILNPQAAPLLYERYGKDWNLIGSSSRNAIRDCTSTLDWEDAVGENGRVTMSTCIPSRMSDAVIADLREAGLTETQAKGAFTFPNALVRKMLPKEQRILAAVAEEQAAIVDLRRQKTLTSIADEEARRRANEGSGIRLMMAELPQNFTVAEMVAMIEANAMKTNAEAFMKAVEAGNPNITVISGGSTEVPVAARAN